MKKLYLLLMFATLMSLTSCLQIRCLLGMGDPPLDTMVIPMDSLELANLDLDKLNSQGITVERLGVKHAAVTYPRGRKGKVKFKNVGNTTIKNSGNTEIDYKDKSVEKDKSKVKIDDSFQEESNNKAREGAVVGDNSSAEQKKGIPPLLIWLGVALLFLLLAGYFVYKAKRKII